MSSKSEPNFIDLFEIPTVRLDSTLNVVEANGWFNALFGDLAGKAVAEMSADFNERKFIRKTSSGQPYSCGLLSVGDRQVQYSLRLKPFADHFIGVAVDASASAKAEAMLASYSEMIEKQNREIKAKTAQVNIWRDRIQQELQQAATVQDLLVPKHVANRFLDSRCEPLQELSGDFHEVGFHADGQMTFISGDVAGKGIYAAIMLAQTLTAFRASFDRDTLTDVAVNMVAMLEDRFPDGLFVALTLIRQSADRQTVNILNLGNPDGVLIDGDGPVALIPSAGPAIGILPADIYQDLPVSKYNLTNKRLYVFTDGVLDIQRDGYQTGFANCEEVSQFLYALEQTNPRSPLDDLIAIVRANEQIDDVTIACLHADPRHE